MAIMAYLNFRGNTREAVDFYAKALDGKDLRITTMGDLPQDPSYPMSDEDKKLIANASLKISGGVIMFSDIPESMAENFSVGSSISLSIVLKDKEEAKKYYKNLADGGNEVMPLSETPWSSLYGFVIDKFGIGWQVNVTDDSYYYN